MSKSSGVGSLVQRAATNDQTAVSQLFQGFMDRSETIDACGYLGTLGILFKEHSFWCVTPNRVCTLRIKRGGSMEFSSGYIAHINSDAFYQPSLIGLWITLGVVALSTWGIGLLLAPLIVKQYYKVKKSGAVFWVREGIPVYIFADRHNLSHAQRIPALIAQRKLSMGAI